MRRPERHRGREIVDGLRHDARPVDRIDARQAHAVAEGVMIEHSLHQRLAIVEGAFDRDGVHITVRNGGHHALLHVGDASAREQHHHVDLPASLEGLRRSATRITGRGHDNGSALTALMQRVIHETRDQLHRQILEGEGRAVKELEHK